MRRTSTLFASLAVVGLLAAACGGDDDASDAPTTTAAAPIESAAPDTTSAGGTTDTDTTVAAGDGDADDDVCTADKVGGELTLSPRGLGTTLDPYNASIGSIQTGGEGLLLYSMLTRYDASTGEYVPHVAKALTPNADASEWTLELRDGVTFGNGDPLDAAALIAHLDRHLSEESQSQAKRQVSFSIESYEQVGDMAVKFTLHEPFGKFPALLAGTAIGMVQNARVVEEMGQEAFSQFPLGGGVGPYEIAEWAPPARVVFEAKRDWWGGPVCIETITETFIPDIRAGMEAFKLGEVDVIYLNRDPALVADAEAEFGGMLHSTMFNAAFYVHMNSGINGYDGPLTDVRVRQAVAHAIDPDVVNARAWGGSGWPGSGVVQEASESIDATEGPAYDPDLARQLLDEYKAETGWDGTIDAMAAATPASNKEAASSVKAMLDAVGFNVNLDSDLQIVDFITQVSIDRSFELVASWGTIAAEAELYNGLRTFHSADPNNPSGFASEAFDAALTVLRDSQGPDQYQAALEQLQAAVNQDVPFAIYGADRGTTLADESAIGGLVWHNGIDPIFETAFIR